MIVVIFVYNRLFRKGRDGLRKGGKSDMKKRDLPINVLKYAILILILFFLLFPLYWVLVTSFKTNMEAYMATPTFSRQAPPSRAMNLFTKNNDFFTYYKTTLSYPAPRPWSPPAWRSFRAMH